MLATIWMCTHEWSLIPSRLTAFTFATCHQRLQAVVLVHALEQRPQLAAALRRHVDPHLRDRLGRREPRVALGLLRGRLVDPLAQLRIDLGHAASRPATARLRKSSRAVSRPSGTNSASRRSFGEWMLLSGSAKPVMIVGMPLSASAGTIGSVPPERTSSGRRPKVFSNASRPSCTAGASGGTSPGGARRQARQLELGAVGSGLAEQSVERGRDLVDVLARREPDREVRLRRDRQHGLLQHRRAARDPVHVERGLGGRAQVELLGGRGVRAAHARLVEELRARARARPRPRAPARSEARFPLAAAPAARRPARAPVESVVLSACIAFSAAPP